MYVNPMMDKKNKNVGDPLKGIILKKSIQFLTISRCL